MPQWEFPKLDPALVEHELTQRDQFNNDDVGLAEALVREVVQNSSDAGNSEEHPVEVSFHLTRLSGAKAAALAALFDSLLPHLKACGADLTPLSDANPKVLVIEDFNTCGLTGRYDVLDEGNFRNFWRRHGKSGKGGKAGGRWGLGKLVYSSSSRLRSFFGLTVRAGESHPLLLGQAVLSNHEIDASKYPPHGFWFRKRGPGPQHLQLPVTDPDVIQHLQEITGTRRQNQSGLSIAIPYISDGVTERTLLSAVVNNYYFPILSGKLVVEVGNVVVNDNTFRDVAADVTRDAGERAPFDFVEQVSRGLQTDADAVAVQTIQHGTGLSAEFFREEDLRSLKDRFIKGEVIQVRVPVSLRKKSGDDVVGSFRLFLRMRPDSIRSYALIARGPITLPGERRYFQSAPALGALVAVDGEVASFLGDAENPAHTAWNANAEKLTGNWRNASQVLKSIRHSLRLFHELVAEQVETRDEQALVDFFALADRGRSQRPEKRVTPVPRPDIPSRPKALRITPKKGGFILDGGPDSATWSFPKVIVVKMAYDLLGADPFKRYSKYDFDLTVGDIQISTTSSRLVQARANAIALQVNAPDFRLEVINFDLNRDLVVDARIAG